ncbi:hypothetical protein [Aliiruegeria lutimaris]|uniref:Uncharacterized protein n=1 Tax=Aliiruegeria lutimaris TaxID=571298 RepID=A0A1G8J221_9RHOB|nr:hypothetical protein [Aliiruegeria lutimaris]SDI25274.1 hypothetical protein SAMN04488026_1001197 [Aliiruegeria lutimaris]
MSEITELESRLAAAMTRIGNAIEAFSAGEPEAAVSAEELEQARKSACEAVQRAETAEAEVLRLQQALEAETTAGAQLRERVGSLKSMKDRQQERITELEAELRAVAEQCSADRGELDELISVLEPLVREQTDA